MYIYIKFETNKLCQAEYDIPCFQAHRKIFSCVKTGPCWTNYVATTLMVNARGTVVTIPTFLRSPPELARRQNAGIMVNLALFRMLLPASEVKYCYSASSRLW